MAPSQRNYLPIIRCVYLGLWSPIYIPPVNEVSVCEGRLLLQETPAHWVFDRGRRNHANSSLVKAGRRLMAIASKNHEFQPINFEEFIGPAIAA